jgi:hypothetical protein
MWQIIIERSLKRLDSFLKNPSWQGRENEVVNLYTHDFLTEEISQKGPLKSLSQVGIEVAVPQVTGSSKKLVRKDLVIWPRPQMTAWPEGSLPAVIMEWKRDTPAACAQDIVWLSVFTARFPQTLGVAVCAILSGTRGVEWTIIEKGKAAATFKQTANRCS